ncbi:GNAT family N-acetyltransferase [Paenibacillus oenotherae]|uniref:GNAT family N-acetyltransferase n=1 Tax=Paenibacillus oenotherae TaxID=1435645 RepID=A0ABS7D3E1_9BACL|nr:GNAT family N-acetyltransferase [Paenibacillus oenotherae]MBW7474087.1 GNAT family N-acetyltransferase [Paenibacillus oenotherae]
MTIDLNVVELKELDASIVEELSELLIDIVEDGASIGFLPPLSKEIAKQYWKEALGSGVILWIARSENKIAGTIQLHLALKQNATHRAEVAKLMVHPSQRRNGIARALMNTVEDRAAVEGRSLLVLDTRSGDPSNYLYQSHGYIEAGSIPNYAISADGNLHDTIFYYKIISPTYHASCLE